MADTSLNDSREGRAPRTPFLKWPGGKRRLVRYILPLLPEKYDCYFEPFLGSGALFFSLQPRIAFLSDNNADLISMYEQVRNDPQAVIRHLKRLTNSKEHYYKVRSIVPTSQAQRAARLIYL